MNCLDLLQIWDSSLVTITCVQCTTDGHENIIFSCHGQSFGGFWWLQGGGRFSSFEGSQLVGFMYLIPSSSVFVPK